MDHVIESLKNELRAYQDSGDERGIQCIKNAIAELEKYYTTE
ncbi:hypothetical protein [Paenibacillus alginolyticus]|nr:hypothetical protein [Paenibacillus alginolyticus]